MKTVCKWLQQYENWAMRKNSILGAHKMNRSGEVPREEIEAKAKKDENSIPVRTVTAVKRQSHKGWHF